MLVKLLKWLRHRCVRAITAINDGQTRITGTDGAVIIVDSTVYVAVQDRKFRESMRDAVAPVGREDIDSVEIGRGDDRERVTSEDLPAFDVPESSEVLTEQTREAFLQLLTITFQQGNKWRFTEGDAHYWAAMEDTQFARKVENHEVEFGKGDILRATVRTQQTRSNSKLHVDHAVIKAHDVEKRAREIPLPFAEADDNTPPSE